MSYLNPVQVSNLLVKKGVPKGTKSKHSRLAIGGVAVYPSDDGWVEVSYNNLDLAEKDKINLESHNRQMRELIHFILTDMNGFEFKYNNYDIEGHFPRYEFFYRKAK